MKYIITEAQIGKFVKRYLDSIDFDVHYLKDGDLFITKGGGYKNGIFHYEIDIRRVYVDPDIYNTVKGMFGLDDLNTRMEILFWFEDKFDRRVDEITVWYD